MKKKHSPLRNTALLLFALSLLLPAFQGTAAATDAVDPVPTLSADEGNWWDVIPEEEIPSPYYDSILYSEIAPKLREIQLQTDRMDVEVIGQSAGGRNLFLVTMTAAEDMNKLSYYRRIIKMMEKNPEKALELIDNGADFKIPFYINSTIHGNEYGGVDASIRMIETLAYENTDQVNAILENIIFLVNVIQNPDGRVLGTRENANGFDVNRDFITQSQPETRATISVIKKWNPMTVLTLHDDYDPMLIEPCSPPHNANYEYDLYIEWALSEALAMEAEVKALGFDVQIPFRDWVFEEHGWYWDDWPPIYDAMYPMYHGAYGHTLETPFEDSRGVDAHYAAMWGALNHAVENKRRMIENQINIFWRGNHARPQQLISDEVLAQTPMEQFNEITVQEFPAAYVIPPDGPTQLSAHQPAELIEFLLFNDVKVEKAEESFTLDGIEYAPGTYVVWLDQPKRGLANTILETGYDVSTLQEGLVFYSPPTAWSHPLLWGSFRGIMQDKMNIRTSPVKEADQPVGSVETGTSGTFVFQPVNRASYEAVNMLLARDITVYRMETSFADGGKIFTAGSFIITDQAVADELAGDYALVLYAVSGVPENAVRMKKQKIALISDPDTAWMLKTHGFDYTEITPDDINSDTILDYDVIINKNISWPTLVLYEESIANLREAGLPEDALTGLESLIGQKFRDEGLLTDALAGVIGGEYATLYNEEILAQAISWDDQKIQIDGREALFDFFERGGDYIGIGVIGAEFANEAGLTAVTFVEDWEPDAIIHVDYATATPLAGGFRTDGFAYALYPAVYFNEIPENAATAVSVDAGDFLAAGFWPGWQESPAKGKPVVIHQKNGNTDITLIGIEVTFRGHPKNSFRVMANAIFTGLE